MKVIARLPRQINLIFITYTLITITATTIATCYQKLPETAPNQPKNYSLVILWVNLGSTAVVGTILYRISQQLNYSFARLQETIEELDQLEKDGSFKSFSDQLKFHEHQTKSFQQSLVERTAALQEYEFRLIVALTSGQMAIWEWNINSNGFTISPNYEELLKFGNSSFKDSWESFLNCVHPQDRESIKHKLLELKSAQNTPHSTKSTLALARFRTNPNTGELRWIEASGKTIYEDGIATKAIGIFKIIPNLEGSAEVSRTNYNTLLKHVNDLVIIIHPTGVIKYISPSVTKNLDYIPERLTGKHFQEFIHLEDVNKFWEALEKAQLEPNKSVQLEYRHLHNQGTWQIMDCKIENKIHSPNIFGLIVTCCDITAFKESKLALLNATTALKEFR